MDGPGADCHTFEYSSAPWILFLKHSPNILVSKVKKYTSNIFLLNLYLYLSFGRSKVGFYNLFCPPVVWWHRVLMKMGIGNSLWNKFKPAIFQNIITLIVTCHKEKKAIEVGNYKFLLDKDKIYMQYSNICYFNNYFDNYHDFFKALFLVFLLLCEILDMSHATMKR